MVEAVREMQRLREVVARMGGESEGEVSEDYSCAFLEQSEVCIQQI